MTQAASRKLKILVVHEISYVEKVIYEVHEFPEILSTRGHDITFIDFAEGYKGRPGGNRRTWNQKGRVYDDAQLTIHSPWLSGIRGIDRLVALVSVWHVLWRLRKQKFDVILNYAVPTYGIQLNLWARALGIPVVHRALDVSHKIRQSIWNPAIELVENIVFKMSHSISTNNPAMADYVSRVSKDHVGQIAVHYPPTYNSDWKPKPFSVELAKSLGIERSDTVIGYLGSFFFFSGLPDVVECFSILDDQERNVKLLLVGGGEQDKQLRELVANKGLSERVIFTGFIDFSEIPTYLSLFDVGINPMHPLDVSNYALPNKVIQYLAFGVPVASTKLDGLYSSLSGCEFVNWVASSNQILDSAISVAGLGRKSPPEQNETRACVAKFESTQSADAFENFLVSVYKSAN